MKATLIKKKMDCVYLMKKKKGFDTLNSIAFPLHTDTACASSFASFGCCQQHASFKN